MLWVDKYSPNSISEVIGNSDAVEQMKIWALEWSRGKRRPPLLISGPTGIGKTCAAHALAKTHGWDVLEVNATDSRDKKGVEALLGVAGTTASLTGALKLIIIDEVDDSVERGGLSAIYEVAKGTLQPVIIIATNSWGAAMAPLRTVSTLVEMRRVNVKSIEARLRKISEAEKLDLPEDILELIAHSSNGDMRSAINDLQSLGGSKDAGLIGERDRGKDIFDCVRKVLKSTSFEEARGASQGLDMDSEMFVRWIDENVPREYENPADIARAFDSLSRADVFYGRIRNRQYWGFLRYFNDLSTAGVALAKDERYHKFTKYSFPQAIKALGASKGKRAKEKGVLVKIGAACHVSKKRAREYLPLVKLMLKENEETVARFFRFEDEDLDYFGGKRKKKEKSAK